ncbi:MAG: Flp pilus assembly protein CpaB [Gemmataceae bacterium]
MKPKTMILMVVAIGCGLAASYMTSRLLAERNQQQEAEPTVPVLVAKARVPGWQPVKDPEKFFEIKAYPQSVAPRRAIATFEEIKGQRLNKPLDETKPVTQDDLLTKEQADLATQLQPGQRAIAIKVTTESLVGGFVLPGSRVDVVHTTRGQDSAAKILLQNMLVLAVDTQDQRNPEQKSIMGQTVTLAATPEEATRLSLASSNGELRLLLKSNQDTKRTWAVNVTSKDLDKPLASGSDGERLVDLAPRPAPAPVVPLPELPPEVKAPVKEPVAEPVKKARKPHYLTIWNGSSRDRIPFHHEAEPEDGETAADDASGDAKTTDTKAKPKAAPAPAAAVKAGTAKKAQ